MRLTLPVSHLSSLTSRRAPPTSHLSLSRQNFVGLTVADGYIACGSETNEVCAQSISLSICAQSHTPSPPVSDPSPSPSPLFSQVFAFHKSLPMPMAAHRFGGVDPVTGADTEEDAGQFVSSVCWRGDSQTLVAANSTGNVKLLEMVEEKGGMQRWEHSGVRGADTEEGGMQRWELHWDYPTAGDCVRGGAGSKRISALLGLPPAFRQSSADPPPSPPPGAMSAEELQPPRVLPTVPETVLKKRKKDEQFAAEKREQFLQKHAHRGKRGKAEKRFKRPEDFVLAFRRRERDAKRVRADRVVGRRVQLKPVVAGGGSAAQRRMARRKLKAAQKAVERMGAAGKGDEKGGVLAGTNLKLLFAVRIRGFPNMSSVRALIMKRGVARIRQQEEGEDDDEGEEGEEGENAGEGEEQEEGDEETEGEGGEGETNEVEAREGAASEGAGGSGAMVVGVPRKPEAMVGWTGPVDAAEEAKGWRRVPLTDNAIVEQALGSTGIICIEDLIHEIATVGPHFLQVTGFLWPFRLAAPRGKFSKGGWFNKGGEAGNRGVEINELIRSMA
ncbi:unnamed protein product [Closterium sp. NIES-54]